jgi:hypothetical protein
MKAPASKKPIEAIGSEAVLAAVAVAENLPNGLPKQAKTIDCHINGALPDPECSPGAIFPKATTVEICISGYTKKVRNVSASLKKKIYKAYGISYPQKTGSYEMDHIIPLELGGSNESANLFPESRDPDPGFREKDVVENFLHQEACAGRIPLDQAQKAIATDWTKIYQSLTSEEIQALKEKFRNWADAN